MNLWKQGIRTKSKNNQQCFCRPRLKINTQTDTQDLRQSDVPLCWLVATLATNQWMDIFIDPQWLTLQVVQWRLYIICYLARLPFYCSFKSIQRKVEVWRVRAGYIVKPFKHPVSIKQHCSFQLVAASIVHLKQLFPLLCYRISGIHCRSLYVYMPI